MKSRLLVIGLLAVITSISHLILFTSYFGERFEPLLADLWFNLRGKISSPAEVVVVAMDELSYNDLKVPLNQQSWPRELHAQLLERLASYKVKRVVFDILFLDPGPDPQADEHLAKAIAMVPTVLGTESTQRQVTTPGGAFVLDELLAPLEPFEKAAETLALVGKPEDFGVIRRFLTERNERTQSIPSLAEAGAGMPANSPQHPGPRDFIKYYGPARSITTFSYYQILQTEKPLPSQMLKDKVVYVGLALRTETGPAQKDVFGSPFFGERIFGSEIHATAAANLIRQEWIRRSSKFIETAVLSIAAFAIALGLFALSPLWGGLLYAGLLILWALISYFCFQAGHFVPGLMLMGVVCPLVYLVSTLFYYFASRKAQQQIQSAFELYLSPEMAKQMAKTSKSLSLGGEKLWATALFTDIAGFTEITEEMPAERVSAMLNAYFTEVMDVVFENKGTLIKFIGDAAFVLWGAPIKIDDHAALAVQTALAIQREALKFNQSGRFPALNTRVGINTGPMVVGNLGSKRRFDYTAIGDSVNLASRVEGLNKYFGTQIMLTDSVKKEVGDSVNTLQIGAVRVVGKREVVGLHAVFIDPIASETKQQWLNALTHFRERNWASAMESFEKIMNNESRLKTASELYLQQIRNHQQKNPEGSWQGEVIFGSK